MFLKTQNFVSLGVIRWKKKEQPTPRIKHPTNFNLTKFMLSKFRLIYLIYFTEAFCAAESFYYSSHTKHPSRAAAMATTNIKIEGE